MREITASTRDRGLRRMQRTTTAVLATAGALTAAFAGLAAKALPGRHTVLCRTKLATPASATAAKAKRLLLAAGEAPRRRQPRQHLPAATQSPPVAVSGGT